MTGRRREARPRSALGDRSALSLGCPDRGWTRERPGEAPRHAEQVRALPPGLPGSGKRLWATGAPPLGVFLSPLGPFLSQRPLRAPRATHGLTEKPRDFAWRGQARCARAKAGRAAGPGPSVSRETPPASRCRLSSLGSGLGSGSSTKFPAPSLSSFAAATTADT